MRRSTQIARDLREFEDWTFVIGKILLLEDFLKRKLLKLMVELLSDSRVLGDPRTNPKLRFLINIQRYLR